MSDRQMQQVYEDDGYFVTTRGTSVYANLFPYIVWLSGNPYNKVLEVTASRWGARWYIHRHQRRVAKRLTKTDLDGSP